LGEFELQGAALLICWLLFRHVHISMTEDWLDCEWFRFFFFFFGFKMKVSSAGCKSIVLILIGPFGVWYQYDWTKGGLSHGILSFSEEN
jgi:hypothetical protein